MTPAEVLHEARAVGLEVTVAPSGNLLAKPAGRLTPELHALLTGHKAELLDYLRMPPAANDTAPDLTGCDVGRTPGIPPETAAKFKAASEALDQQIAEAVAASWRTIARGEGDASDPDRWCWPSSPAMTTREMETYSARLVRFIGLGLSAEHAERLADRLVIRDREQDDRRVCIECTHVRAGLLRCANWRQAGIGAPELGDMTERLQHCDGFKGSDQ